MHVKTFMYHESCIMHHFICVSLCLFVAKLNIHNDNKINFAGLKDKYALTSQYLSIMGRGLKEISEDNFTLIPLGRSMRHVGPDLLKGNRFRITIRSLEKE